MPWLVGVIVNLLIGIAVSYAASLLSSLFSSKSGNGNGSGIRSTISMGGDQPLSFIMGRYGTAGHLEYVGTWGNDGETPNAYLTHVISVSDLPTKNFLGRLYVNGVHVTLDPTPGPNGYPILEYRTADNVDHMWVNYYDGTQTTADPFLLEKFGADPDRPWQSDMIGRGIAYATVTALVNRELFNGVPEYFFEVFGLDFEGTDSEVNPVLMIKAILSGITYGDEWVWGLQGLPASRLPSAVWDAQAAKCDVLVAKKDATTEKRFRTGIEVTVDKQPIEVIQELLDSCNGRIAEIGGIYKILVAEPEASVASFTDEDVIITAGQSYSPFPGLESTFNGMNATYPEPEERWAMKDAPPFRRTDLEVYDDNRRLPFDGSFPLVYSNTQVQRLMKAIIKEDRRFRTHSHTMPPSWWEFEPLDAVTWTSDRNGYENKVFLITSMDDLPTANQVVNLREQDHSDYDWTPEDDEGDYEVIPPIVGLPAPQLTETFDAEAAIFYDSAANARRPSIAVIYAPALDDVQAVRVQVREDWGDKAIVFQADLPYDKVTFRQVLNGIFLPAMPYEVRGRYIPYSGRVTRWSNQDINGVNDPDAWVEVTTDDVRLGGFDLYEGVIGLDHMAEDLEAYLDFGGDQVREVVDTIQQAAIRNVDQDASQYSIVQQQRTELKATVAGIVAAYSLAIAVAVGPDSAMAQRIETIEATIPSLATASSLDAVTSSVSVLNGLVTANTSSINSINAALPGKASVTALNALSTTVNNLDDDIEAVAESVTSLDATVDDISAQANIRMRATAGSAGYSSKIVIEARTGGSGTWRTAAIAIDVPASTSDPTRVAVLANQFVIQNSLTGSAFQPFIVQSGVVYMDVARIRDLTVDTIKITGGAITDYDYNQLDAAGGSKLGTAANDNALVDVFVTVDLADAGCNVEVHIGMGCFGGSDSVIIGRIINHLGSTVRARQDFYGQYMFAGSDAGKNFMTAYTKIFENVPAGNHRFSLAAWTNTLNTVNVQYKFISARAFKR